MTKDALKPWPKTRFDATLFIAIKPINTLANGRLKHLQITNYPKKKKAFVGVNEISGNPIGD
jgi:hypothetical protein